MLQHTEPIFSHSKGRWPPETSLWHNSTGRNNAQAPTPVPASERGGAGGAPQPSQGTTQWGGVAGHPQAPYGAGGGVVGTAMATRSLCDPPLQVTEEKELSLKGQKGAPRLWDWGLASLSQPPAPLGCSIQG